MVHLSIDFGDFPTSHKNTKGPRSSAATVTWLSSLEPKLALLWFFVRGSARLPSGKPTKNDGKSPFSMGKSTINGHFQWKITIFNGKIHYKIYKWSFSIAFLT